MNKTFCFLLCLTVFVACRKQVDNNRNYPVHLSGQVIDSSTNKGIAAVPVTAVWQSGSNGFCISCSDSVAGATTTGANGYFDFTVIVDTFLFERNYLSVHAVPGNGYLSFYHDKSILAPLADLSGIRLTFFPKTTLTINSVNGGTDSLSALNLSYAFTSTSFGLNNGLEAFPKPSLTVETAANMYTQINWTKVYGFGNTKDFSDSIKCIPGISNVYTLRY